MLLVLRAQKKCSKAIAVFQCAALILILSSPLVFNACSGTSVSSNSTNATTEAGNTNALKISANLPPAAVDSSYSGNVAATGGTAPYTFWIASGQLPDGLKLNDDSGAISGTPTASGAYSFAVSVSDSKGTSQQQSLQITVSNSSSTGTTGTPTTPAPTTPSSGATAGNSFSSLQHSGGWNQYGQGPPNFVDCSPSPCDGISFSMTQGVNSPSISGQATEFNVGGSTPYSDALWNNHLIGPSSSQGMDDTNQSVVHGLHNFTYDVYFYGDNLQTAQALEFDVNQFFNNIGLIFGHECRLASGNEWDVWDNGKGTWTPTGIPCYPNSNSWNHLTIKVQRTSNNEVMYQSITLNGSTANLNWTMGQGSTQGWYGLTINFQMDGNAQQDSYNVYLDNLTFSYQ